MRQMRQMREWRDLPARLRERRQWFQLGMISATMLTPLVSRWRSLRAAERARDLWEASQARTRWPWTQVRREEEAPLEAHRDVRPGLWLAGVGVGLVAAGGVAVILTRRRMRAEGESLEVPIDGHASVNGSHAPQSPHTQRALSRTASQAASAGATGAPAQRLGVDERADDAEPSAGPRDIAPAEPPPVPLYIGNMRTMIYAPADEDLPPIESRVYFASEDQARQAGYRTINESSRLVERDTGDVER